MRPASGPANARPPCERPHPDPRVRSAPAGRRRTSRSPPPAPPRRVRPRDTASGRTSAGCSHTSTGRTAGPRSRRAARPRRSRGDGVVFREVVGHHLAVQSPHRMQVAGPRPPSILSGTFSSGSRRGCRPTAADRLPGASPTCRSPPRTGTRRSRARRGGPRRELPAESQPASQAGSWPAGTRDPWRRCRPRRSPGRAGRTAAKSRTDLAAAPKDPTGPAQRPPEPSTPHAARRPRRGPSARRRPTRRPDTSAPDCWQKNGGQKNKKPYSSFNGRHFFAPHFFANSPAHEHAPAGRNMMSCMVNSWLFGWPFAVRSIR